MWGEFIEIKDEAESCKKLDEQKRKLQKELPDVERLSFVSKEMQESIMDSVQLQLQEVEKRRHDLMLDYQKAQKKSQKIHSIPDWRRNMLEMRKLQQEIGQKEERHLFLSIKIYKNKMQEAEMMAELQILQTGEERRGSNVAQTGDCCLEALWQQFIAMGANQFVLAPKRNGSGTGADARKRRKTKE